jgi:diaminopimelate epimerase
MYTINFSKLHGQGNDFIIIDAISREIHLEKAEMLKMCDRHFGIGADGIILVRKLKDGCFFMDYYNADGTVAEMCGNGIRCMARFLIDKKLAEGGKAIIIDTRAGLRSVEFSDPAVPSSAVKDSLEGPAGKGERAVLVKVNMGNAIFEPQKIPVNIDKKSLIDGFFAGNYLLKTQDGEFTINCVSMGNPHCVIFLEESTDLAKIPLDKWGPAIENSSIFPNKTNVEFIKIIGPGKIQMRVWERGVGETMACGTGACASAVCAIVTGRINASSVAVILPGGSQTIYWEGGPDSPVFLEGQTGYVFEGQYYMYV